MRREVLGKLVRRRRREERVRGRRAGRGVPRLVVFRSNRYVWAQVVGGGGGVLAVANTKELAGKGKGVTGAVEVGELIAERAKKKGVEKVVFDRGSYKYHGRVKAVAEGARKGGLVI